MTTDPPTRRTGRRLAVAAASLVLVGASLAAAFDAQAAVPPTGNGWTNVFADDFTGPAGSRVDDNWRYTLGTSYPGGPAQFGTGEVETMTDSTHRRTQAARSG